MSAPNTINSRYGRQPRVTSRAQDCPTSGFADHVGAMDALDVAWINSFVSLAGKARAGPTARLALPYWTPSGRFIIPANWGQRGEWRNMRPQGAGRRSMVTIAS